MVEAGCGGVFEAGVFDEVLETMLESERVPLADVPGLAKTSCASAPPIAAAFATGAEFIESELFCPTSSGTAVDALELDAAAGTPGDTTDLATAAAEPCGAEASDKLAAVLVGSAAAIGAAVAAALEPTPMSAVDETLDATVAVPFGSTDESDALAEAIGV